jgi:putative tricarboxylic transport membrane protein
MSDVGGSRAQVPPGRAATSVVHRVAPWVILAIIFGGTWGAVELSGMFGRQETLRWAFRVIAVGLGIAAVYFGAKRGLHIRNPQDAYGGVALILLALFAFWAARDLPGRQGFAFGPGTAPRLFASLLIFMGAIVAGMGLIVNGPRVPRFHIRGPLMITIALLTFATTIRPMGLIVATFVAFMVAAAGSRETRWMEATLMAMAMTAFCVFLFPYALNLPFQLWPRF